MAPKIQEEPGEIYHEDGVVIVDGPDGCALSLSPRAAKEMAKRLIDTAEAAYDAADAAEGDGRHGKAAG
ncbi:hypothetical protein [Flavisphingomonas formosensis]|uniref:hypothetical protein n=1 Tax=Flavisphingomonas formosensis TaxID=861534 RepID=UPI0012FCD167|nr:hypothetical protein [Sphingomonas formosensis]